MGTVPPPWGHLVIPRGILEYKQEGHDATGTWGLEARNAAKHPTAHRTDSRQGIIQPERSIVPRLGNPGPSKGIKDILC